MVPRGLLGYNERVSRFSHVRKPTFRSESVLPLRRPELRGIERRQRPLVGHVELVWRLRSAGDASGAMGRKTGSAGRRDACLWRGLCSQIAVAVHGQPSGEPDTKK